MLTAPANFMVFASKHLVRLHQKLHSLYSFVGISPRGKSSRAAACPIAGLFRYTHARSLETPLRSGRDEKRFS
jgi:hypothetical protein